VPPWFISVRASLRIRCFGRAPDALWWDMGVTANGEPLARYFGDGLVKRRPFVPVESPPRVAAATATTG